MSVPLLLERSAPGMGSKVPTRVPFNTVVVEGLSEGDSVALFVDLDFVDGFTKNGAYQLDLAIPRGVIAQARLLGENSKVSVYLEDRKWA
jgi:hypothetical protein